MVRALFYFVGRQPAFRGSRPLWWPKIVARAVKRQTLSVFLVSLTKVSAFHHHKLTDFPIRCTIYYFQKLFRAVAGEGGCFVGRLFGRRLAVKRLF